MTTAQLIELYTPSVDIISLVFCCLLTFVIGKVLFFFKDRKFIYLKRALLFTTVACCCNIAFYCVVDFYPEFVKGIIVLREVYHVSLMMSLYCFILYMEHMINLKRKLEFSAIYLTRGLFLVCLILEIASPFTKFGFYLENGRWNDSIYNPYDIFYVYAFSLLFLILVFYSKRLIRYVRVCLAVTGVTIGGIMIYQAILNINTFTAFTYVLPPFIVMILLHSKPFDDKTGALDAGSFDSFIKQTQNKGLSIDFVTLWLNTNIFDVLPDELGKVLNSFWHDAFSNALSFNISSGTYVLAVPRSPDNTNETERKINKLVDEALYKNFAQYRIPYKLVGLYNVDFIENITDLKGVLTYLLVNMEENSILTVDEEKKNVLRLMKQIKENLSDVELKHDLNDERVVPYFQPVRNMKTGVFDTAEALMRLNIDGKGIVMPSMFITMAEEYGYISTLTKIMFNKVCRELKVLEQEGFNFKRVSVNVSAVDLRSDGFCEEIIKIIKDSGLDCSKIGIELTESQTDRDFEILNSRMKLFHDEGMTLYLDDVGTGYSNLDRIIQYDVDVVKFDRFFLLEAEKSRKVVKMVKHLSQAFIDLDYKLLYEGVETDSHEELCLSCGADYIQGFKYAKPVPAEELKNYFSR